MTKVQSARTIRDVRLKTSAGDSLRSLFEVGKRGVQAIEITDGLLIIRGDLASEEVTALPLSSVDLVTMAAAQPTLTSAPRGR